MEIEIKGKTYKAYKDKAGWTLECPCTIINKKTKEQREGHYPRFYGNIQQCLGSIVNEAAADCETTKELKEIISSIEAIKSSI